MLVNKQMFSYFIYLLYLQLSMLVENCSMKVIGLDNLPRLDRAVNSDGHHADEKRALKHSLEDFINRQTDLGDGALGAASAPELSAETHYLYRVQKSKFDGKTSRRVQRRSISSAVIETARCEHVELLDCEEYDSDEMTCMVTATGMPCCICSGKLKSLKIQRRKKWSLW